MVKPGNIKVGDLIIHKDHGVCHVIDVFENLYDPRESVIKACSNEDKVLKCPCNEWFHIWLNYQKVAHLDPVKRFKALKKLEKERMEMIKGNEELIKCCNMTIPEWPIR